MGMGFFEPHFALNPVLYFYGIPNPEKALNEHAPTDSIVFEKTEYGSYTITYAPPWLQPAHLKLDYDILLFSVLSVSSDFARVTVNSTTGQTHYVSRQAGSLQLWPDFLLRVHSVELLQPEQQPVRIKALDHASVVSIPYEFLKPLEIQGDWMRVELWDRKFESVGKGWVRWQQDGKLLISYSLLS